MTSIVVRADASLKIGSGHVMRSRTLARELRRRGAEITFVCRRQPGDLIGLLEQEFPVLALPKLPLAAVSTEGNALNSRDLYASWLGCSPAEDAADSLHALQQAGLKPLSWVVVDHYGLDAEWEKQILANFSDDQKPKLLVIDDLADRPHHAHCLLDQNFFANATEGRYAGLVQEQCRKLLGPQYALLGPEYAHLHQLVPPRKELRRLLVFFGGVDRHNLTIRTLESLKDPPLCDLAVDVVLGLQSPHRQAVAELVSRLSHVSLYETLPSLAGLIARADMAIGASGATTWERACLALPSLVVAIADNQLLSAQALNQAGHVQLLGDAESVSVNQIRGALLAALQTPLNHKNFHYLTDGMGAARAAISLLGPKLPLQLRPSRSSDEALLLHWANEPQVRHNSFSPALITWADHHRWFQAGLTDSNRLLLIANDASGCPIGQIRFDRHCSANSGGSHEALIDLSLDRCARGYGLASHLLLLGLQAMQRHWGPSTEAVAYVLNSNSASSATFARAGFSIETDPVVRPETQLATRWCWRPANSPCLVMPSAG